MSVAVFIAAQRAQYRIPHATACRALGLSQAWFYKWRHGDASPRHARRHQLRIAIERLFAAHKGRYGSPRITAELREQGWRVSVNTVAQIMAERHLRARPKRRRHHTTRPGRGRWRAPDLIGRDFAAATIKSKVVRRRHRDHHRGGQALLGQRVGYAVSPDRWVRDVDPPRHRLRLRLIGDGGRGPRRNRSSRRGDLPHRSGQRVHRAPVPHRL